MTMSTPSRSALIWGCALTPPKTVTVRRAIAFASGAMAVLIWVASSRVGARINARGRDGRRLPWVWTRRARMGNANAYVLPEPVRPRPRMSRPASESGSVAVWIGNGSVIPARARAATSGFGTPSYEKVIGSAG